MKLISGYVDVCAISGSHIVCVRRGGSYHSDGIGNLGPVTVTNIVTKFVTKVVTEAITAAVTEVVTAVVTLLQPS